MLSVMARIVLNKSGVSALLKSQEMMNICKSEAIKIKNRCGEGYGYDTYVGKTRVNASVFTASTKAMKDNSENNTLLKNMR